MKISYKEPMNKWTSFKVGGPVDVMVDVESEKELIKLVKFLNQARIKYVILGRGTNVLVTDKGMPGVVIHMGRDYSKVKVKGTRIECEVGAPLLSVCDEALSYGLTGLEPLSGIPGTIGGAVAMNAGAFEKEIKDFILACDVLTPEGKELTLKRDEMNFSYRHSIVDDKNYIITKVYLSLTEGDKNQIKKDMQKFREMRNNRQPIELPSAGSTFKRPQSLTASELIDKSGMKGASVGDAEVSEKHCGFIVNKGNAKASDILKLIKIVQNQVKLYFGVDLEPEIKIWGK